MAASTRLPRALLVAGLAAAAARTARADTCVRWGERADAELALAPPISESSGVARSARTPGLFWTVEDSGHEPVLHAVRADGRYAGASRVRGAENVDWEALGSGPCPGDAARTCLYIGDIGDNKKRRDHVTIYVVPEPTPGADTAPVATWRLRYPAGPRNAEALLVHPSGAVRIVTKDRSGASEVYAVPGDLPAKGGEPAWLQPVARIDVAAFTGPLDRKVTGGDFDADGDRVALRTRTAAWEWSVDPCDVDAHWDRPPVRIDIGHPPQPEALAYTHHGGLVATSEGRPMPISVLRCAALLPATRPCGHPPMFEAGPEDQ